MKQNRPAVPPSCPVSASGRPDSPTEQSNPADRLSGRLGPNPTPTQLAELDRWLRDPEDPRTPEQIRSDLEFLGEVAALPTLAPRRRWWARWFR